MILDASSSATAKSRTRAGAASTLLNGFGQTEQRLPARKIGRRDGCRVCHLKAFLGADRASAADPTASKGNHQTRQASKRSVPLLKLCDPGKKDK